MDPFDVDFTLIFEKYASPPNFLKESAIFELLIILWIKFEDETMMSMSSTYTSAYSVTP